MWFAAYLTGQAGVLICGSRSRTIFIPENHPIRSRAWTIRCRSCSFPGLACSPRIFAPVIPALWRYGPVTVANHIRDDNMGAIARRILAEAPPRFALAGHSMGGYIAFEIMRQAPERVAKLALMNTQARPDTPEAERAAPRPDRPRQSRRIPRRARRTVSRLRASVAAGRRGVAPAGARHGRRCRARGLRAPADRDHRPAGFAADAGVDQVPDAGAVGRRGQHHPEFALDGDGRAAFPARNW